MYLSLLIKYGMHGSINHHNTLMVGHVYCVIYLLLESPHINIKKIYMLIIACFLMSNNLLKQKDYILTILDRNGKFEKKS